MKLKKISNTAFTDVFQSVLEPKLFTLLSVLLPLDCIVTLTIYPQQLQGIFLCTFTACSSLGIEEAYPSWAGKSSVATVHLSWNDQSSC